MSAKIQRLIKIIYLINNQSGINAKQLAKRFNVTKRTIHRYLEDINSIPDITVEYDPNTKGYEIYYDTEHVDKNTQGYIWTNKDYKILEVLTQLGISNKEIAQLLGRTEAAVAHKKSQISLNKTYKLKDLNLKEYDEKTTIYLDSGTKEKAKEKYKNQTGRDSLSQLIRELLHLYVEYG